MGDDEIIKLFKETPYDYRWARKEEWKPAMMMVWKTFMKFESPDYSQEGIREFFEFITDDDIYRAFLNGTYRMMVALDGDRIIGVASLRNRNILSLLFVDEQYHRKGVGSVLLELLGSYVKDTNKEFIFHVKAAPYAVAFYRNRGFRATSDEQEKGGIRVTPMEKVL
ncbi:MAG: GNAT family N-acetyltransferase [Lachnospiraceae bacterium]|nr:GNAT family N-acetyltransferase [Lachnospiraceae bacterium]